MGDLIVTCTSAYSRNRRLGQLIGEENLEEIIDGMEMVAEGVKTTEAVYYWARKILLKCPLLQLYTKCFSKE